MREWTHARPFSYSPNLLTGTSAGGLPIEALQLSGALDMDYLRPSVLFVGGTHGNHAVGRQLILRLAVHILCEYAKGATRIRNLLDFVNILLIPTLNPDGYEVARRAHVQAPLVPCSAHDVDGTELGRNNSNNIDIERNFPKVGGLGDVQPETSAFMNWVDKSNVVLAADIHGGNLVVAYPWDRISAGKQGITDDNAEFVSLASKLASTSGAIGKVCCSWICVVE